MLSLPPPLNIKYNETSFTSVESMEPNPTGNRTDDIPYSENKKT